MTRNVTQDPERTLTRLFERHGIDLRDFDLFSCIPFKQNRAVYFRQAREHFRINPALAYACGDEYGDYCAALEAAMYPFMVAYGAEDQSRLQDSFKVPAETICTSPQDFIERLRHTLDLTDTAADRSAYPRL